MDYRKREWYQPTFSGDSWVIQVKSREEALEWAALIPGNDNEMVEVRGMFEITDFPADVQKKLAEFWDGC